jgi:hypothetical protein
VKEGYQLSPSFLSAAEVEHWRQRVESRRAVFRHVTAKAGMNLSYSVMHGHQVQDELPDLFDLVQGRLHEALQDAAGQPLVLMRDRKRAVRIQWYRRRGEGFRWHLDGGMYSVLLTLVNTNQGATQVIPPCWSRFLKPVPYVLFPFQGLLARAPTTVIESRPGDLLLIQGGAIIHRGTNDRSEGERVVLVASFDPVGRRPTPVWDWLARRLNY